MGTPTSADTPNQANYEDSQNFDVNIGKLVKDWIVPIDEIRSYASIVSQTQNTNTTDITAVVQSVKTEQTVQESRCHAFYRWIGFPVVDASLSNIYNPGFDIVKTADRKITVKIKVERAKNPITSPKKFNDLSILREKVAQTYLKIFSNNTSIDAAVLALSNGGTKSIRKFVLPLEQSSSPFDMDSENQSFQINIESLVGENETPLSLYQDSSGKFPSQLARKRYHLIRPFIVDPRIDFTVSPQNKLVAVPFVSDNSFLKVDSTHSVRRPLIEKIIRDRFAVKDVAAESGTSANTILKIIADYPDIKDNNLVSLATNPGNLLKQSEQIQLNESINVIKSLMGKLVEAQNTIREVQGEYYWVPIPSASGPEGGVTSASVFFPTIINPALVTEKDAAIFLSAASILTDSINTQGNAAKATPDPGSFGLPSYTTTFGTDTTNALGDNSSSNLETLSQRRARRLSDAATALQTIEIITGDFSGLGLCDIVAIISALNVIPKENLLGFLDADAQTRAKASVPELAGVSPIAYGTAMQKFCETVKDFYNLMDKIYLDRLNNGS